MRKGTSNGKGPQQTTFMQKSMALFYLNGTSRDSMYYEKE
jgi:hypothetical protein